MKPACMMPNMAEAIMDVSCVLVIHTSNDEDSWRSVVPFLDGDGEDKPCVLPQSADLHKVVASAVEELCHACPRTISHLYLT